MLKVGLTGGIGSGKSTVTSLLRSKGFEVVDADLISREVLNLYPQILMNIKEQFGPEFIDEKGKLKRKALGDYVFKSTHKVKKLEDIILPYIIQEVFDRLKGLEEKGESICFVDAPTLIEVGLHKKMDLNMLVWVDTQTQVNRVMTRDKVSREEAFNRINVQLPLEDKKKVVDFVIDNSGSMEQTQTQVEAILEELARV